jgi:hypothetical protein
MSRVDDLIKNYEKFARLPWIENLAPSQRVWMAVYAPEEERRHARPTVPRASGTMPVRARVAAARENGGRRFESVLPR